MSKSSLNDDLKDTIFLFTFIFLLTSSVFGDWWVIKAQALPSLVLIRPPLLMLLTLRSSLKYYWIVTTDFMPDTRGAIEIWLVSNMNFTLAWLTLDPPTYPEETWFWHKIMDYCIRKVTINPHYTYIPTHKHYCIFHNPNIFPFRKIIKCNMSNYNT